MLLYTAHHDKYVALLIQGKLIRRSVLQTVENGEKWPTGSP